MNTSHVCPDVVFLFGPDDWVGGRVADSDPEVATAADPQVTRLLGPGAPGAVSW